jgi:uncharacterized LabA/DUF88 family protein
VSQSDRLRIAVFIDFDNIEIGVKNTMGAQFDAGLVLEALKERGEVVSKTAYSDWQRAGGYSRSLTQHAIRMVQRNLTPGGDKNGADINLALDALEMAFTHPHINAFVIVGGDSDFISLVEKLKQYDKKVFIVGGRQFTSIILQRNCHEFIAYENLMGAGSGASQGSGGAGRRPSGGRDSRGERAPIEQAIPLVTRALKVLSEREVSPQLGLLKSTLLQLDSTFSERSYGAGSFRDFVEKLANVGVVRVYQAKGGWLVGAMDGAPAPAEGGLPAAEEGEAAVAVPSDSAALADNGQPALAADRGAAPSVAGSQEDGLRELARVLSTAQVRRWPMYLRNAKQLLRQAMPPFDERAYGFASIIDLLRAANKEGLVRVERDRQGVIRVFQGSVAVAVKAVVTDQTPAAPIPELDEESFGNVAPPEELEAAAAAVRAAAAAESGVEEPDDNFGNVDPAVLATRPRRRRPAASTAAPRARQRRPRKTR